MLARRDAWAVALVATLTMTVSYIDRVSFSVLGPTVTEALDISEEAFGWLGAAFSIAYLVATPLAGWWIDRVGARKGLVWSVLIWSTVAALHALAPSFAMLFALRIALGLAEGPGFPGAAQAVHRALPPHERARGFGVLFTGSSIGGMLVPGLATFLFAIGGWRFAFLGTALAGLLWIPLWLAVTQNRDVRDQIDTAPEVKSVAPRASFGELVSHPIMIRSLIGILAIAPVIGFIITWGAKYLVRTFEIEQVEVARYLWVPPLLFDVGAILFGDLSSRQRRAGAPPRLLYVTGAVLASGIALLPLAQTPWQSIGILAGAMAGGGALYTLATAELLSRMPPESVSLAGGIMAGAQSVALIVSSPLIGWAVDRYHNYDAVAIALGLCVVPGSLVWLVWRTPDRYAH